MTAEYARIAYFMRSELRQLQLAQAREIKRRHNAELHLYCADVQQVEHYRKLDTEGLFASISHAQVLLDSAVKPVPDEAALFSRAQDFERRIGMTINRLAVSNRHLGRGYALGAYHFPLSRYAVESSYPQMVQAFVEALAFWEKEFTEKRITLVMNGLREAAAIARMLGIPYRYMMESRYLNRQMWMHDEYDYTPELQAAYARDDLPAAAPIDAPYDSHVRLSESYLSSVTFKGMAKRIAYLGARQAYWHLRGYWKARSYRFTENAKYVYRSWSEFRRLRAIADGSLADLAGKRFVYYPLHYEPERALQGISPEYFYQLSCIAALSRDLPAGVMLAVKDQFYSVAARPDNFYAQIQQLKNVFLIDPLERGLEVVKAADAVATICGTSGFEAAALGRPVIAFGRHNTYGFLPHVWSIVDEADLPGVLRAALDSAADADRMRADGQRFLNAVAACSYDMQGYTHIELDSFVPESVTDSIDALDRSLTPKWLDKGMPLVAAATGD